MKGLQLVGSLYLSVHAQYVGMLNVNVKSIEEIDMEELKLLIEAIAGLPTLATWVIMGYMMYKLAIVGSIYATIRFMCVKFVEWRNAPKVFTFSIEDATSGLKLLSNTRTDLINVLRLMQGRDRGYRSNYEYVHDSDMDWLRSAVTEKLDREEEARKARALTKV